jgi:hypothetical protein
MRDMEIIYAIFAGSEIRDGAGKYALVQVKLQKDDNRFSRSQVLYHIINVVLDNLNLNSPRAATPL